VGTQVNGSNIVFWQGSAVNNGANINVGGTYGEGDLVQIAVDMGAQRHWVRKNNTGDWNGTSGATPETGVGGIDVSSVTDQTTYAYVRVGFGGVAMLQASADRLVHAAPVGFAPIS
jgi:hypothetical protein